MKSVGLDIGSRTVKIVLLNDGNPVFNKVVENSFNPLEICKKLLQGIDYDNLTATGYGRHLIKEHLNCEVISEIKAFAIGTRILYPNSQTILDIGGQDIKAISLTDAGKLHKFEMNDKCSAGTGRFLEIMAMALGSKLEEFGNLALSAERSVNVNAMCTVFAESEVISLLSRGAKREEIALGIHQSVVSKSLSFLKRVMNDNTQELVFVGGVAYNPCIIKLIGKSLENKILIPKNPQILGALGAAKQAEESMKVRELN